jgi:hypothetical protein
MASWSWRDFCSNGTKNDVCLARYNPIGSLDMSFNTTGKLISPIGASDNAATAVALQPDGKIVVAGYCSNGSNNDFCLARYEAARLMRAIVRWILTATTECWRQRTC